MSKKSYQRRLPTVLPPAPRSAPPMESLPPVPVVETPPEEEVRAEAAFVGPPDRPPPDTQRPRSRTALATLVLLGPLVLVGALLAAYASQDEPDAAPRGPAPSAPTQPGPLPEESYVEARVQRDGDIVVRQWIRSGEPLREVVLGLPDFPGAALAATRVQVLADDASAAGPRAIDSGEATYSFEESTDVEVRYRLIGAVLRGGTVDGRALAVATTLDVTYASRPAQETRVIRAPEVLSLACATTGGDPPQPCGSAEGTDRWRVDLSGLRVGDRVLAQLTLDAEEPPETDETS